MNNDLSAPANNWEDGYLVLLAAILLGYAMLGKGFAVLGVAPIYMGEAALLGGLVVFLGGGCLFATLATAPTVILAATIAWILVRTVPFTGEYGSDALRDSVAVVYAGFCFITVGLLLNGPHRIDTVVRYCRIFFAVYVPAIPFLFAGSHYLSDWLPQLTGTSVRVISLQPGEVAAHLAGAAVFSLVGLYRATPFWISSLVFAALMIAMFSRGPMLALVIPITFAALMLGKWRQLSLTLLAAIIIVSAAYVVEPLFVEYVEAKSSDERPISTRQLADNVLSLVGQGGQQGEGTKTWRIDWWNKIVAETVFGPYFWLGRGFGPNIALADGFSKWTPNSRNPPLRAPHSIHMTILARAGVPGVILWLSFVFSWFGMIMRALFLAHRRGHNQWSGLFLFISCYVASMIINASFDPALEAPMQGVWFWSLVGFGSGSAMVYRWRAGCAVPLTTRGPETQ